MAPVIAGIGMAISLTCTCGARLEIDDAFAGKTIPCPDCQRPLNTSPAVEAPPERPPSVLALSSLIVGLVGALTFGIGSLTAITLGALALRQSARDPERRTDVTFARAGIIAGGVGLVLTLAAMLSSNVLGVDALLREFRYAGDVEYRADADGFFTAVLGRDDAFGIQRPSRAWGRLKARGDKDNLTIVNLRDDAYLVCVPMTGEIDEQAARDKAAERLRQSDLFKTFGRASDTQQSPEPEAKPFADSKREGDQTVDVRLGGYERTFLMRVVKVRAEIYLLGGGARKERFARLTDDFLKAFDSFKQREN
jgi:hypothetical protein